MDQNSTITFYKWIIHAFTANGRSNFVKHLAPHLTAIIHPQDQVLDLCCGTGPFSFFIEEQGARVTAIDFAPYMIQHAREAASKRHSTVDFIQADVLAHDLGTEQFDLAVLLGNTISDFTLNNLAKLGRRVGEALKRGGRFVVDYIDGLYQFVQGEYPRTFVQQDEPERITIGFKEYLPEKAAYIEVCTNEATGEVYEYTAHVHAPPHLRLAMGEMFELERTVNLNDSRFLDIFLRR